MSEFKIDRKWSESTSVGNKGGYQYRSIRKLRMEGAYKTLTGDPIRAQLREYFVDKQRKPKQMYISIPDGGADLLGPFETDTAALIAFRMIKPKE
jgi:hypothetical protein